jgi:mannose-6-phosphate isomerase-like protein (cupin superfamily)
MSETPYTHKKLTEVEDSAPGFGFEELQEAHFAYGALDCDQVGFAYHRVKPGKRQAFGHKHDEAEEVYVVVSGSGRVKLDDDVVDLARLDALRVAPTVMRQFEAGPDGLELVAFGQRHQGDGEIVQGWWSD